MFGNEFVTYQDPLILLRKNYYFKSKRSAFMTFVQTLMKSFTNFSLEACSKDRIEKISNAIDTLNPFEEKRDYFATSVLSESVRFTSYKTPWLVAVRAEKVPAPQDYKYFKGV